MKFLLFLIQYFDITGKHHLNDNLNLVLILAISFSVIVIIVLIVISIFVVKKQKQGSDNKVTIIKDKSEETNEKVSHPLNKQGSGYSEVKTYEKQSRIHQPLPKPPLQNWSDVYMGQERCCSNSNQFDCSNTYDVLGHRQCSSQFLSNL